MINLTLKMGKLRYKEYKDVCSDYVASSRERIWTRAIAARFYDPNLYAIVPLRRIEIWTDRLHHVASEAQGGQS